MLSYIEILLVLRKSDSVSPQGSPIIKVLAGITSSGLENEQFCVSPKDSGCLEWKQKGPQGPIKDAKLFKQWNSHLFIFLFFRLPTEESANHFRFVRAGN